MSEQFIPSLEEPKDEFRNPLVRFRGVLKEYVSETVKTRRGNDMMQVKFNFTDVEVIESNDPYPFPIATIVLAYAERSDTVWDVWRKSVVKLLPSKDINELVGKQQEWHFTTATLRRPLVDEETKQPIMDGDKQKWGNVSANAWQIVALEGVSAAGAGKTLMDTLTELAVGKTDSEFYQELLTKPELKKMAGFQTAVEQASQRVLLTNLAAGGLIKQGLDGRWEKA